MTFAKKMQASGFYYNSVHKMTMPMRHHNTWLGDPVRALLALNQNKLIKRDNLMENAITTSAQLRQGLLEISSDYP
jgi:4-aminobutyrate aminotransferase-like enzyme